ncbi:hypothetical protein RFI_02715, partial [Reticulomyxa filosa]
ELSELEQQMQALRQQKDEIETRLKGELVEMERQHHSQVKVLQREKEEYITATTSAELNDTTNELQLQIEQLKHENSKHQASIDVRYFFFLFNKNSSRNETIAGSFGKEVARWSVRSRGGKVCIEQECEALQMQLTQTRQ